MTASASAATSVADDAQIEERMIQAQLNSSFNLSNGARLARQWAAAASEEKPYGVRPCQSCSTHQ
jgi:hypothetical protein